MTIILEREFERDEIGSSGFKVVDGDSQSSHTIVHHALCGLARVESQYLRCQQAPERIPTKAVEIITKREHNL